MTPDAARWAYAQAVEIDIERARAAGMVVSGGGEVVAPYDGPPSAAMMSKLGFKRVKRRK